MTTIYAGPDLNEAKQAIINHAASAASVWLFTRKASGLDISIGTSSQMKLVAEKKFSIDGPAHGRHITTKIKLDALNRLVHRAWLVFPTGAKLHQYVLEYDSFEKTFVVSSDGRHESN
jgi:hypothetical protein